LEDNNIHLAYPVVRIALAFLVSYFVASEADVLCHHHPLYACVVNCVAKSTSNSAPF